MINMQITVMLNTMIGLVESEQATMDTNEVSADNTNALTMEIIPTNQKSYRMT